MSANSFPLNTDVEIGQYNVTHAGDKLAFAKKNTMEFKGVLSNYKQLSGDGIPTTTGNSISWEYENGVTIFNDTFKVEGTKVVKKVTKLECPISGNVTDAFYADGKSYFTLLEDREATYIEVTDGVITNKVIYKTTDSNVLDVQAFLLGAGFIYSWTTDTNTKVRMNDGTIVTISNSGVYTPYAANNGKYVNSKIYFGRDDVDSRKAWYFDYASQTTKYGFGKIGNTMVTGEPIPNNLTPTVMPNGVLRWDLGSAKTITEELTDSEAKLKGKSTPTSFSDTFGNTFNITDHPRTNIVWLLGYKVDGTPITHTADAMVNALTMSCIDPATSMGNFWSTTLADAYENVFPMKFVYTNQVNNKGKVYDWGEDWSKCYFDTRYIKKYSSELTILEAPLVLIDIVNGTKTVTTLDATGLKAIPHSTTAYYPFESRDDNTVKADETVWGTVEGLTVRIHPVTSDITTSASWTAWVHTIGDVNSGDHNIITSLPFNVATGDIAVQYFNNIPMSVSYNKVLLNTASTGIDRLKFSDNTIIINDTAIEIGTITNKNDIKVEKIADYKFKTNILADRNAFNETRDGKLSLIRAFIPYNMECTLLDMAPYSLKMPSDGGASNDVFYFGAGHNVNLEDKDISTSYLLPPVTLTMFVDTNDLDYFNGNFIRGSSPILSALLVNTCTLGDDVDVYYTHSLASTDITYKGTFKVPAFASTTELLTRGVEDFDSEKDSTSWWLDTATTIFPMGITTEIKGKNYISSTLELDGNYSCRLYNSNNTSFLAIGIANQQYYGSQVFTISTSSYYYDGQAIYYVGNLLQQTANEFVCYAIGMDFLANSGTEAYFYNPLDKSIWKFTGSNTLSMYKNCTMMGKIIDAAFCSSNQTLYVLFEDGLFVMNDTTSALFPYSNGVELYVTNDGCAVIENGHWSINHPYKGVDMPFEIESEYFGDDTSLFKFGYLDLLLYSEDNAAVDLTVKLKTLNQAAIKDEKKVVHIAKNDWKEQCYRLRFTPKELIGCAFSFSVYSDRPVSISYIGVAYDKVSDTVGVK